MKQKPITLLRALSTFLLAFTLSLFATGSLSAAVIFVDVNATGSNNGTSWANAYKDLQDALDNYSAGDEIRVAEGTYYPTEAPDGSTSDARNRSFHLANNDVTIRGGWDATSGTQTGGESILSGDIGTINDPTDNCYHVLIGSNLGNSSKLENLVIEKGHSVGASYSSVSYNSISFLTYFGAGVYLQNCQTDIEDCIFRSNQADQYGGGLYYNGPTYGTINIDGCTFEKNSSRYYSAMNIRATYGEITLNNSIIRENTGDNYCVFLYVYGSTTNPTTLTITNCQFLNNTLQSNFLIYNTAYFGTMTMGNNQFVGNTVLGYLTYFNTSYGNSSIYNCNFSENTATSSYLVNSYSYGGNQRIANCNFSNNSSGGSILYGYYSQMNNCVFHNNTYGSSQEAYVYTSGTSHNAGPGGLSYLSNNSTNVDLDGYSSADIFANSSDPDGNDNALSTSDDGYMLASGSPLLGAGSSSYAPTTDIIGATHANPPSIGAYAGVGRSSDPCDNDDTDPTLSTVSNITVNAESGECGASVDFSKMVVLYNPTGYHNVATPFDAESVSSGFNAGKCSMNGWPNSYNYEVQPIGPVSTSSTIQTGEYVQFDITFPIGALMSHVTYHKQSYFDNGARKASIRSSVDGFSADIDQISCNQSGLEVLKFDLSGMSALSGNVVFRIYFWDATGTDYMDLVSSGRSGTGLRIYIKDIFSASDDCELVSLVHSGVSANNFYGVGTHTISATATDASSNSTTNSFTITVVDNQAPTITCPAALSVSNDAGACGAELTLAPPTVIENCNLQGTCLNFDGNDDFVKGPDGVIPTSGEFTVMVWAKQLNNHSGSFRNVFAQGRNLYLGQSNTGIIRIGDFWGNTGVYFPTDNAWHHYAIVRKTNNTYLYIDGSLAATKGSAIPSPTQYAWGTTWPYSLNIGSQWFADGGEIFDGDIDEFQVWGSALSETAIDCYMNQILSGSENGLVAYYNFEDGNGSTTLTDAVSVSNDGALTNMDEDNDWVNSPVPSGNVSVWNDYTNNCDASGTYPVGTTTVTWYATDQSGNTSSCTQSITVNDTEGPNVSTQNISVTLSNGSASVSASDVNDGSRDNCGIDVMSVEPSTFDCDDIGEQTVTLTIKDIHGNESSATATISVNGAIPSVSISESELPELCQGGKVVLSANATNGNSFTYLWSTDESSSSIQVETSDNFEVEVTNDYGCSASTDIDVDYDRQNLFSSYTIIATKEVHLDGSEVQTGGVGAIGEKSKITVHKDSKVTGTGTFAIADKLDVKSDGEVTTAIEEELTMDLPDFQYNTNCKSKNDVTIGSNTSAVLTGSVYGKVQIGKNSHVTFTQDEIFMEDLKTGESDTIEFSSSCATLYVCKKVELKKENVFNSDAKSVFIYCEEDFKLDKDNTFTGSVYSLKHIHSSGDKKNPNIMTGLYLAEKVDANNTIFNWNTNCGTCDHTLNKVSHSPESDLSGAIDASRIVLNVYPNPNNGVFDIDIFSPEDGEYSIDIYDNLGRKVYQSGNVSFSGPTSVPVNLTDFSQGQYFIRAVVNGESFHKTVISNM